MYAHGPFAANTASPPSTSTSQGIADRRQWAKAHPTHSNHGRHKILPLVPHQGIANHPLPLRFSHSRPSAFPPPIPHFITPRRRTIRQRSKIQAQRPANHSQQEEEEVLHKLRHSRSARCSTVQPGGCHAVRKSRRILQSNRIDSDNIIATFAPPK
jgi:hypothetical protein